MRYINIISIVCMIKGCISAGILILLVLVPLLSLTLYVPCAQNTFAQNMYQQPNIILTWTDDPATSQAITWLMPKNGPARVQYAEAQGFAGDFNAARQVAVSGEPFAGGTYYRYTVTITALNPGTEYLYRVGRDGRWSSPATFSTAPAKVTDFTFLYLGDVHYGFAAWAGMLEKVYRKHPCIRFALLGGDLTDDGNDEGAWLDFMGAAAGLFSRIPVMPTKGNHDGRMYMDFFALPQNGPRGLEKEFYSFAYGDAHFIALNSSKNVSERAKQWLREDLEATDKKWKFVFFHHPAYPAFADYKGIDRSIRENWISILEEDNVDMVFVGHQHLYMRTHPLYREEVQTDAYGIVYVMGNSGPKLYGLGQTFPYIARAETGSNYQLIEISGDTLTLTARKDNGELIERFTITKAKPVSQPTMQIKLAIGQREALLNGRPHTLETPPYLELTSGRTLVPLRFVGEVMGAEVAWNPTGSEITTADRGKRIVLTIGAKTAFIDGAEKIMDTAPAIIPPGRTFVPLRFVGEALGLQVDYVAATKEILISR